MESLVFGFCFLLFSVWSRALQVLFAFAPTAGKREAKVTRRVSALAGVPHVPCGETNRCNDLMSKVAMTPGS